MLGSLSPPAAKALRLLSSNEVFKRAGADALLQLVRHGSLRTLAKGDVLMRQGEPGGNVFVVLEGRVRVVHQGGLSATLTVAELGPGDVVGEVSALVDANHENTVLAQTDVQVLEILRGDVRHAMDQHDALSVAILSLVQHRALTGPPRSWG